MHKKTAYRWRMTLIMLFGVAFALGTFWLVQMVNQAGRQAEEDSHRNEPDYIIERFSFVRLDQAGQPSYIIAGDKLTHHPADDSSDIEQPTVHSLSGDQPPMNVRARQARVDQDNSRVKLSGDVRVDRPATATSQAMQMNTSALTLYPDDEKMETDQPVSLQLGATRASGTGMKADNATRQIQLGGRGQINMPPRAAH